MGRACAGGRYWGATTESNGYAVQLVLLRSFGTDDVETEIAPQLRDAGRALVEAGERGEGLACLRRALRGARYESWAYPESRQQRPGWADLPADIAPELPRVPQVVAALKAQKT